VEARVQAMLEPADSSPPKKIRPYGKLFAKVVQKLMQMHVEESFPFYTGLYGGTW
jgi:hypothetical protein